MAVFLLSSATLFSQQLLKQSHDMWKYRDDVLEDCALNIGLFQSGFIWVDVHGHSWWVLANPAFPYRKQGDKDRVYDALTVNAYLSYNALDLARQEGWPVFSSLDEYLATPSPSGSHPPIFQQNYKRDKGLSR